MKNKVAIVTGSAKGIGKELIIKLASINYDVIITYNTSKKEANNLLKYIKKNYDVNAFCIKCDITNEDEIQNMLKMILTMYSKIDLLINNAAYCCDNYIDNKSKSEFMRVLEVNVVGTFLVTKYLYPYLDNGVIVNVSSTDAIDTYNSISMDYCASKAAINSLTKTFAQQFDNIKVIGVMPSWTNTESVREMNSQYLNNELKRTNQKQLCNPKDVANNIVNMILDETVKSSEIRRV